MVKFDRKPVSKVRLVNLGIGDIFEVDDRISMKVTGGTAQSVRCVVLAGKDRGVSYNLSKGFMVIPLRVASDAVVEYLPQLANFGDG